MYSEWTSMHPQISTAIDDAQSQSVLNKFSIPGGKDITHLVVKQVALNLGITQQPEPSPLTTDQEVLWCMDVICYGLQLPLSEHETIKDCVNVYCEWLTALQPVAKLCVPRPIVDDANVYGRKMISHLHNLFIPRQGESSDTINRQAVLCHRVLRTLQHTVQVSQSLTRETWEAIMLFLLAINEILLAPPTIKDDVGDQLCERVLSVLFEVWLLACVRSFPSPSLWKTFQESCAMWRHRIALIEQWNRVNLALTARLLGFMYGPGFPELKILDEDAQLIPAGMTNDCIAQTWYRFLRIIGSPTDLCSPQVIGNTPQFIQFALFNSNGQDPSLHPCLHALPQIFLKAIKGLASQVDAFLGIYQLGNSSDAVDATAPTISAAGHPLMHTASTSRLSGAEFKSNMRGSGGGGDAHAPGSSALVVGFGAFSSSPFSSSSSPNATGGGGGPIAIQSSLSVIEAPHSPTPPLQRRLAKSFSVAPSLTQNKGLSKGSLIGLTSSRSSNVSQAAPLTSGPPSFSSALSLNQEQRTPVAERPKCNSILHLFGEWLFEAAHIGSETWLQNVKKQASEASRRPSSMIMDSRKGSLSLSQPSSLSGDSVDGTYVLTIDRFESGRAEAIGALCRIFCAKKTGEEIIPVYLARFYVALQQGLKVSDSREVDETMASILYSSANLFRIDLDGIHVLLPSFVAALELVLPEKELRLKNSSNIVLNKVELRRSSINILLSILALPLHFQSLPIKELNVSGGAGSVSDRPTTSFIQLKSRLINILMNALQVETDPQNTHMLLGGLLMAVQDAVNFEESEASAELLQTSPPPSDMNLLSSACSEQSAYSVASAASSSTTTSLGGGTGNVTSTTTFSIESASLTMSDDFPAELLHDLDASTASIYDSAHALFVRATYLVCHRLISSWKTDLNVSLAALELLSGLARMYVKESDALECKRAVKWICDYICYQCSRPPPAHSKDLHSTIVAAFQCTSAWLMQHPYLLQDKECLTTVLEVIELGISGSKSVGKPGEAPKLKDEKELKPVSMRVRDAAEILLTLVLEQVGYFPNTCGPQSPSSLLDEVALVRHCRVDGAPISQETAVQRFKYFVTENSTVLALLEEPLGNEEDPQPTVTLLIRGPFGRHAWTLQLRHLPRSKKYHAQNPGRPVPMNDVPVRQDVEQRHFPEGVERVPPCVADYSIPTLEEVIQRTGSESTRRLFRLLEEQMVHEKLTWAQTESSEDSLSQCQEAAPPPVCHEFQAARLLLSNFGFLPLGAKDTTSPDQPLPPPLTVLDTKKVSFANDLRTLDKMSPRTCDTVHIFYVRSGQTTEREIINNASDEGVGQLDAAFWAMLRSLGWPVRVDSHPGWTGSLANSWRITSGDPPASEAPSAADNFRFNGEKSVLYWADVSAEIAFVVPTRYNREDADSFEGTTSVFDTEGSFGKKERVKPRTLSLDLEKQPLQASSASTGGSKSPTEPVAPARRRTTTNRPPFLATANTKIFLVWLESFEDHLTFPVEALIPYTKTGEEAQAGVVHRPSEIHIIFLHALSSGLLRVKLQGPAGRVNFATPLIDGMVVSKRAIGALVRQTAYNMSRRRRLENEIYQPPHVRRRVKVQEMVQKYKLEMSEPELLAYLFKNSL